MSGRRVDGMTCLFAITAGAVLLAGPGCGGGPGPADDGRIRVVASILPLADAARQIGGDHVAVTTLLPPGQTPHGYTARPRQVEALAEAHLLLTVGLGLDPWAVQAARAVESRDLVVLEFAASVSATPIKVEPHEDGEDDEDHDHAHAHALGDPHLWLNPVLMKEYGAVLAGRLTEVDPARADDYRANLAAWIAQLDDLDRDYRRRLATARHRAFVSYHSAFTYLAARYGLKQEAAFEVGRGGLGAEHLERVIRFVREHDIKVIFAEPQFPLDRLRALTEATGAVARTLDPLGDATVPERASYVALMRTNLAALCEALECDHAASSQPSP